MPQGHGEKLSRKKEQAIAALLESPTVGTAAAQAGVNEKTLKKWLADSSFQAAYRLARQGVLERTVARLLAATGKAVQTLTEAMEHQNAQARIRAALGILSHAVKGVEALDLAEQLTELQSEVEKMRHGHRGYATGSSGALGNGAGAHREADESPASPDTQRSGEHPAPGGNGAGRMATDDFTL